MNAAPSTPVSVRRKWLIRGSLLAVILVLLLAVGTLLAPTLMSTQAGTRWTLGYVNDSIAGELRLARMKLSWLGGQSFEGLELVDSAGKVVASVNTAGLPDFSLWQALRGSRSLGTIELGQVDAHVVLEVDGRYNLIRLLTPAPVSAHGSEDSEISPVSTHATASPLWGEKPSPWSGNLVWQAMDVRFDAPQMKQLTATLPAGSVDVRGADELMLNVTATLTQGHASSQVAAKGTLRDLFTPAGALTLDQAHGQVTVSATDLPLEALDRLANLDGRLATWLGPTLAVDLAASGSARALDLSLDAHSQALSLNLTFAVTADALTLQSPGQLHLRVTPRAWSSWMAQATLDEPVTLALTVNRLVLPHAREQVAWSDLAAALTLDLSDGRVRWPNLGAIGWSGTQVQGQADRLGDGLKAQVSSQLSMGNQPEPAGLIATADVTFPKGVIPSRFDEADLTTQVEVMDFPVAWLDQRQWTAWTWLPILGPTASLHIQGQVPNDLTLNAHSDTASLAGRFDFDGANQLLLRDDLVATLRITPAMAKAFLGAMHPIFQDAVQSQTPARLVVHASQTPLVLGNVDVSQLQLSGTLDGGTVVMRRGGWMDESIFSLTHALLKLVSLGQAHRPRPVQRTTYPATFTPMHWTLKQGILDASETWVTSPDLALGFVGSVNLRDLANPTIDQMVMGVLEASLIIERPILGRFIEPDQIADLPLSGPLNNPHVDHGIFIQDMAGSVAVQTTRENLGGLGGLIGGLIEGVGGAIKEDRHQQMGIAWHPPAAAIALIEKASQIHQHPSSSR